MSFAKPTVRIELFGIARRRAGRAEFDVAAPTIHAAVESLGHVCPALTNLIQFDGVLSPHYLISINAGPFVRDLHQPLQDGDRIVVLSADAGG